MTLGALSAAAQTPVAPYLVGFGIGMAVHSGLLVTMMISSAVARMSMTSLTPGITGLKALDRLRRFMERAERPRFLPSEEDIALLSRVSRSR